MKTAFVYHPKIKKYSFGKGHPFSGKRFEKFLKFFEQRCENFEEIFEKIRPEPASDEALRLVHGKEYLKALKKASEGKLSQKDSLKYFSIDNLNPETMRVPRGIEKGARISVGASKTAGELVAEGRFKKAIGIGGGTHHAKRNYGEGFCFLNDVAVCVENLKRKYGLERILILDTDAHAGNGTAEILAEDNETLFIDFHQDPKTIYPGRGFIFEIGKGRGEGFTINLPLLPGASNTSYLYLLEEVVFPLAEEFKPEIILRYGGSDPYYQDKLCRLGLTLRGFKLIGEKVRALARKFCQEKEIDLLASGYNLKALPYCWSALISGLLNLEIDLSDFEEKDQPNENFRYKETKAMTKELKSILKKHWKCMG